MPKIERHIRLKATEVLGKTEKETAEFDALAILESQYQNIFSRLGEEDVLNSFEGSLPSAIFCLEFFLPDKLPDWWLNEYKQRVLLDPTKLFNHWMVDRFIQTFPDTRDRLKEKWRWVLREIDQLEPGDPRLLDNLYLAAILFPERLREWQDKARAGADKVVEYVILNKRAGAQNMRSEAVELILLLPETRPALQGAFRDELAGKGSLPTTHFPGEKIINSYLADLFDLEVLFGRRQLTLNQHGQIDFMPDKLSSGVKSLPERELV